MASRSKRQPKPRERAQSRRDVESPAARIAAGPIVPLVITAAVYIRGLGNQFVYDDNETITLNRFIGSSAMLWRSFFNDVWWFRNPLKLPQSAYYRPLHDVWLALNFRAFGLDPLGWHVTLLAMHLVCVWLVFRTARELTSGRWTPPLAALLFGVIPVHAQVVVWVSAVPFPMSAAFEMAAFLGFVRARKSASRISLAPLVFYSLALLSHESAIVFPLIVAACVYVFPSADGAEDEHESRLRRLIAAAIAAAPFIAEGLVYLAIRYSVLGFIARAYRETTMTTRSAILTIPGAIGAYVILLMLPWRAAPAHQLTIVASIRSPQFYIPIAALAAIALAARLGLRTHRHRKLYLFCALWILACLIPVLNLRGLNPEALVEDRYLYLASAAWCVFAADLIIDFAASRTIAPVPIAIVAAAVAALYALLLIRMEPIWHDEVALFSACIANDPYSALYHSRLGMAYSQQRKFADAERELNNTLELKPGDPATLYNLGALHDQLGRKKEAAFEIARGLEGLPDAPAQAWVELAKVADEAGDSATSESALARASKLPGGDELVAIGRVQIKMQHNDLAGAESILHEMTAVKPDSLQGWVMLGGLMAREGRTEESLDAFKRAMAIRPNDPSARLMVASILHRMGRDEEARSECERILQEHPGYAGATQLLAEIRSSAHP